jgi:RNA polymerase sigma factor (TIGR02999 family)
LWKVLTLPKAREVILLTTEPMDSSTEHITRLLNDWQSGDRDALDRLMPLVYEELRAIASRHLAREHHHHAIQTTALVNEAFVKLVDQRQVDWQSRAHFFAIAARVMRRILIDDARWRLRQKRGGDTVVIALDDVPAGAQKPPVELLDVIAVDRALRDLERLDADQARIVELRFFGGLTAEETGAVLGISRATVEREWALAKGWLYRALASGSTPPAAGAGTS